MLMMKCIKEFMQLYNTLFIVYYRVYNTIYLKFFQTKPVSFMFYLNSIQLYMHMICLECLETELLYT